MKLNQAEWRSFFENLGEGTWTVIADADAESKKFNYGIYCALSDPKRRSEALAKPDWDLTSTDGAPGFSESWTSGAERTTYHPSATGRGGVEPLVLKREYYGASASTIELDQQFRLFHNLRHNVETGEYFKMHTDGTQVLAVKVEGKKVSVRTPLLRQYIAARQVDLLLFIDSVVLSEESTDLPDQTDFKTDRLIGFLHYGGNRTSNGRFFTRYLATKVITPGPRETCGLWPYESLDTNFPLFIIGEDEMGQPIMHTCNPDELADYFGKNADAPHYLTPVHFRKEVLHKYYAHPELYTVDDCSLQCSGLWGVSLDTELEDRVVVFLGDIGRDLPPGERDYWRGYMIAPDQDMSETYARRSFFGQFADPTSPDIRFRHIYTKANKAWRQSKGWPLFREPQGTDAYMLKQLRLPLRDSQNEFEEALRLLAKLMSDAINEKELQKALPTKVENEKGISKLERYLIDSGYTSASRDISYLRRVQELRSKATAHLKGSDYDKSLTKNLGDKRGRDAIRQLLEDGITFLGELTAWTENDAGKTDEVVKAPSR